MSEPHLLIEVNQLYEDMRDSSIHIVECRGAADFAQGHIPGAVNLPANLLQDPDSETGALLPPNGLTERFTAAGIGNHGRLVFYDDSGLVPSARLFWALELFGRRDMQLLNGGIIAWQKAGLPLEEGMPRPRSAETFSLQYIPDTAENPGSPLATKQDIYSALEHQNTVLIDARTPAEYSGRMETAARNGHIPGAVHINWEEHILDLFDPTFRPLEELRELYAGRGVTTDKPVIVYCRSGSRSTHSYFTLRLLGYRNVRNYAGSWLEWGNDPNTPVE